MGASRAFEPALSEVSIFAVFTVRRVPEYGLGIGSCLCLNA